MSPATFTTLIEDRYFEDYPVSAIYDFAGTIAVGEAEIIAFARQFDPQPFHIDREVAQHGEFGGIIASGWHTAGIMMRLYADQYLSKVASLTSPGVDELRWLKPVRPGDVLSLRVTVLEANRSRSKPDRGIVRSFAEVLNQRREVVMSLKAVNFLKCRHVP
jgi:acyl dehydratase